MANDLAADGTPAMTADTARARLVAAARAESDVEMQTLLAQSAALDNFDNTEAYLTDLACKSVFFDLETLMTVAETVVGAPVKFAQYRQNVGDQPVVFHRLYRDEGEAEVGQEMLNNINPGEHVICLLPDVKQRHFVLLRRRQQQPGPAPFTVTPERQAEMDELPSRLRAGLSPQAQSLLVEVMAMMPSSVWLGRDGAERSEDEVIEEIVQKVFAAVGPRVATVMSQKVADRVAALLYRFLGRYNDKPDERRRRPDVDGRAVSIPRPSCCRGRGPVYENGLAIVRGHHGLEATGHQNGRAGRAAVRDAH
jgi:hypothetical protein